MVTDWCPIGIAVTLLQRYCNCKVIDVRCCPTGWKIIMMANRFNSKEESRYSAI